MRRVARLWMCSISVVFFVGVGWTGAQQQNDAPNGFSPDRSGLFIQNFESFTADSDGTNISGTWSTADGPWTSRR